MDECVVQGRILDLAGSAAVDRAGMLSWGASHTVSAEAIRQILLGRVDGASSPVAPGTRRAGVPADPHGLRLRGAVIVGRIDLVNVDTDIWFELVDCLLPDGIDVRGARLAALVLQGCRIAARPGSPPLDRPALDGRRLRAATVVDLSHTVAVARTAAGAVDLLGAHLGELDCRGARLGNRGGPALLATRATIERGAFLRDGFVAVGAGEHGAVNLNGARIGGQLDGTSARIACRSGPALYADFVTVEHDVFLRDGFRARGSGRTGAVGLSGAKIGGQLDCGRAALRNPKGPALRADGLKVDHELRLNDGFRAGGHGPGGAVRVLGAQIGGQMDCRAATLRNLSGPALIGDSVQVGRGVLMDGGFVAAGADRSGVVRLPGAHIGRYWILAPSGVTNRGAQHGAWSLDGLTYDGVPGGLDCAESLELLRIGIRGYASQPYQQLAAVHRAAGHDREVRQILVAQRRHQLDSGALTGWNRAWVRFTGWTLGYGYQPWRALIGLLIVLAVAVLLCLSSDALRHTRNAPPEGTTCRTAERVLVAVDLAVSPVRTGIRTRCDIKPTRSGDWLNVTGAVLTLLVWGLTALFVAGFTNAVRKA